MSLRNLATVSLMFVFICCKKNEASIYRCDDYLPCKSTLSCKVNGQAFVTMREGSLCDGVRASYYRTINSSVSKGYLSFSGENCPNQSGLGFAVYQNVQAPYTYVLDSARNEAGAGAIFPQINYDYAVFQNIIEGELKIDYLTPDSYDHPGGRWGRVQGTFWVTLTNDQGDTVRITDGKFDIALP